MGLCWGHLEAMLKSFWGHVDNDNNDTNNEIVTNENGNEIDVEILNEFDVDSLNFDELLSGKVYEGEKKMENHMEKER